LFLLFFGVTVPLAIASPAGIVFPSVFAFGTVLPLLGIGAVLAAAKANVGLLLKRVKRANRAVQYAGGVIFVLVGIHEVILYWLI
jgi:cytochrome c-type biogenesis protein